MIIYFPHGFNITTQPMTIQVGDSAALEALDLLTPQGKKKATRGRSASSQDRLRKVVGLGVGSRIFSSHEFSLNDVISVCCSSSDDTK